MNIEHYTYHTIWSEDDQEYVGLCTQLPSLSWLAATPGEALAGICNVVREVVEDMKNND